MSKRQNKNSKEEVEPNDAEIETKRREELAFDQAILSKARRISSISLEPTKLMVKADGKDIVKKSSVRRNRYLLVFNCKLAPAAAGRLGTLAQLDSKNPVMYIDFDEGRLKLFGTLVFPNNKYMVLKLGNKEVLCEDVLESMIVFSESYWVGTKEENPDEDKLPMPLSLTTTRHTKYDFGGRAGGKAGASQPQDGVEVEEEDEDEEEEQEEDGVTASQRPRRGSSRSQGKGKKKRLRYTEDSDASFDDDDDEDEEEDEEPAKKLPKLSQGGGSGSSSRRQSGQQSRKASQSQPETIVIDDDSDDDDEPLFKKTQATLDGFVNGKKKAKPAPKPKKKSPAKADSDEEDEEEEDEEEDVDLVSSDDDDDDARPSQRPSRAAVKRRASLKDGSGSDDDDEDDDEDVVEEEDLSEEESEEYDPSD